MKESKLTDVFVKYKWNCGENHFFGDVEFNTSRITHKFGYLISAILGGKCQRMSHSPIGAKSRKKFLRIIMSLSTI